MPRGKGRKDLPYRNAAACRRPLPVAPRQVNRQNIRRRPLAQWKQAKPMGALFKFTIPMIMTPNLSISLLLLRNPNLLISLLLLRTITMEMLLHHIYFLHPKLYNWCHRLTVVRL